MLGDGDLARRRGKALVRAEETMNLLLAEIRELREGVDEVLTWAEKNNAAALAPFDHLRRLREERR